MKSLAMTAVGLGVLSTAAGLAAGPHTVAPGGVVRWAGPSLLSCSMGERQWEPQQGACWYPIDLEASGTLEVVRRSTGGVASRQVEVGPYPYSTQRLTVEEKYVNPPLEVEARIEREQRRNEVLFQLESGGRVELPLAPPLASMPKGGRFGARRMFNGESRSPHSGADFAAATGTPVWAIAAGTVVLAEELYFAGNSVYLDHGDGLLSMSLHLSHIGVQEGQRIERGAVIGKVGATGRVTGPHLHLGLRWHGARVDPSLLLGRTAPVDIR